MEEKIVLSWDLQWRQRIATHNLVQLMGVTATGVGTPLAVHPVGEGNRSGPGCATTPPPSTMEKTANGLDQLMRQGLAILSTAQLMAITVNGQNSRLVV